MTEIKSIIDRLQLLPHPEGGYYRETYRSKGIISRECLGKDFSGDRNFSTYIYYLLLPGSNSVFHRIKQDEGWHFYDGSPLELHLISQAGVYNKLMLGRDLSKDETPQFVIPGGTWFAASVSNDHSFSLIGCTVAPGFDFADFEIADCKELLRQFPQHAQIIKKFSISAAS
jgi:hypothetical protein